MLWPPWIPTRVRSRRSATRHPQRGASNTMELGRRELVRACQQMHSFHNSPRRPPDDTGASGGDAGRRCRRVAVTGRAAGAVRAADIGVQATFAQPIWHQNIVAGPMVTSRASALAKVVTRNSNVCQIRQICTGEAQDCRSQPQHPPGGMRCSLVSNFFPHASTSAFLPNHRSLKAPFRAREFWTG